MPLINRVTRLFRSDMHAILDRIEEPEILLRQAIREMDDDVMQDKQYLKRIRMDLTHNNSVTSELQKSLAQLDSELDICFNSAKDDLARSLIKRKLETERRLKSLALKQEKLNTDINEMETRLEQKRSRLAAMQQKLEVLAGENEPRDTGNQGGYYSHCEIPVSSEDVEVAFLKEKHKRAAS